MGKENKYSVTCPITDEEAAELSRIIDVNDKYLRKVGKLMIQCGKMNSSYQFELSSPHEAFILSEYQLPEYGGSLREIFDISPMSVPCIDGMGNE